MIEHTELRKGPAGRRFTTLVVDDEPDLADIAGELLTYHDIDTLVAYSAREALALLETRKDIDAVFSDVMMPLMTGLDLAETITETYPTIKIVLTSGFTALAQWDRHTRRFPFVAKPYSIEAVIRLLKS
ncbi:MAG: response regulator [Janthinobacterium lividum]